MGVTNDQPWMVFRDVRTRLGDRGNIDRTGGEAQTAGTPHSDHTSANPPVITLTHDHRRWRRLVRSSSMIANMIASRNDYANGWLNSCAWVQESGLPWVSAILSECDREWVRSGVSAILSKCDREWAWPRVSFLRYGFDAPCRHTNELKQVLLILAVEFLKHERTATHRRVLLANQLRQMRVPSCRMLQRLPTMWDAICSACPTVLTEGCKSRKRNAILTVFYFFHYRGNKYQLKSTP